MLDIYELQIFLAAAETGNFSEAGRRLQMSQPAVSQQIRSLENRLNVELFCRSGRHIRLTEIGQALIPMARELVNRSIYIEEAIASLEGEVTGMLKLACSTTAGKYVLPRLIARFIDEYPSVQVACHVGSRGTALEMLLKEHAHIAITSLREASRELDYRQFITDPVVLIVPPDHRWARRRSISVDELTVGRFIVRESNSGTQQTVIQALAEHNMGPDDLPTVMVLGNSEAIHMAVSEHIGVAFVSRRAAAEGIMSSRVVEVTVKGLEMHQQLYLVRRSNIAMPGVQTAFWDFVFDPDHQYLVEPAIPKTG